MGKLLLGKSPSTDAGALVQFDGGYFKVTKFGMRASGMSHVAGRPCGGGHTDSRCRSNLFSPPYNH